MARTYLSTLSPRRRWGIAFAAAATALLLAAGLGNPWTGDFFDSLSGRSGLTHARTLIALLGVFRWTPTPSGHGGVTPTFEQWIASLVLDLGWPLLVLLGTRLFAGGLAMRRAKLSLVLGVWSVMTLFGAAIGVVVGVVDHGAGLVLDPFVGFVPAGGRTVDRITLEAGAVAVLGAALGWLPGVFAAIAYSIRRPSPETAAAEASRSGESTTLDFAGLESLRSARHGGLDRTLPDSSSSRMFTTD